MSGLLVVLVFLRCISFRTARFVAAGLNCLPAGCVFGLGCPPLRFLFVCVFLACASLPRSPPLSPRRDRSLPLAMALSVVHVRACLFLARFFLASCLFSDSLPCDAVCSVFFIFTSRLRHVCVSVVRLGKLEPPCTVSPLAFLNAP